MAAEAKTDCPALRRIVQRCDIRYLKLQLRLGWCLLPLLFCPAAFGLDPARDISQFHHSVWTSNNGAPGAIHSLAQTSDGYVWLGTQNGLYRFDGVQFEGFQDISTEKLSSSVVYTLLASASGGLWIGYTYGGVSFFNNGHVTNFSERDGLPAAAVISLAEDRDGKIWAATRQGLRRLDGSLWHRAGGELHLDEHALRQVYADREGTIWVAGDDALWFKHRGSSAFEIANTAGTYAQVAQSPDGAIWLSDASKGVRRLDATSGESATSNSLRIPAGLGGLLFDRDGALWSETARGVWRIGRPAAVPHIDHFDSQDGLSGDYVFAFLEDREGNIWLGTSGGLDRFRDVPLVKSEVPRGGQYFAIATDVKGNVWRGDQDNPPTDVQNGIRAPPGGPRGTMYLYSEPQGSLLVAGWSDLWRLSDNHWTEISMPSERSAAGKFATEIVAMTTDNQQAIWISIRHDAVYKRFEGRWARYGNLDNLPKQYALAAATDQEGHLWFGYRNSRIAVVDGDSVRIFTTADGLDIGNVLIIAAKRKQIFAGGENGLARFDGQRFTSIAAADGHRIRYVSEIVETSNGDLWLNGADGVTHIAALELQKSISQSGYRVSLESYGYLDGLPGFTNVVWPRPTAAEGPDGRIWFATSNGVVWIDPANIRRNNIKPPVWIQSVETDGRIQPLLDGMRLPVATRNLQIHFTALSLSVPARVRFRYQLQGVDTSWQDPGSRRSAIYTNLGPGRYRFSVVASNNDGVWNDAGDTKEFFIPPRFYQTTLFNVICAGISLGMLRLFYLYRLRAVGARLRGRLEERLRERERIARELHDTLLQEMQGLVYKFQAAAENLPDGDSHRARLEEALDRADGVLEDGRGRVLGLRGPESESQELFAALSDAGRSLSSDRPARFHARLQGEPKPLHPIVREEVFRIAAEALTNAFNHAEADRVEMEVRYGRAALGVLVRDDGVGIQKSALAHGEGARHFGLVGMRERASNIHSRLEIFTNRGAGTEVRLLVPSVTAYRARAQAASRSWLARLTGSDTDLE